MEGLDAGSVYQPNVCLIHIVERVKITPQTPMTIAVRSHLRVLKVAFEVVMSTVIESLRILFSLSGNR
jgi:hypothetical protein